MKSLGAVLLFLGALFLLWGGADFYHLFTNGARAAEYYAGTRAEPILLELLAAQRGQGIFKALLGALSLGAAVFCVKRRRKK